MYTATARRALSPKPPAPANRLATKQNLQEVTPMKAKTRKRAKVQKILPPLHQAESERAEIAVEEAEPLYREIRIENKLHDDKGRAVKLKPGAEVEVVVEAEPSATTKEDAGKK